VRYPEGSTCFFYPRVIAIRELHLKEDAGIKTA
jgi:hypothetical protein